MSTATINSLESTMDDILCGRSELAELREDSPATMRKLTLARLGRRGVIATDPLAFLAEAATHAARALEADHYVYVGPRAGDGKLTQRWGAIFPDVLGDDAGELTALPAPERSACAYAIQAERLVVVENNAGEKRFRDPLLSRLGASSGLILPMGKKDRAPGSLAIFNRKLRTFTVEEVLFLEGTAQIGAAMLVRTQTEQLLASQGRFLERVMDAADNLVLVISPEGAIQRMNRGCEGLTGFQEVELKRRSVWSAFLIPEEIKLVKTAFDRVVAGLGDERVDCFILSKHGERRRVAWNFSMLADERGGVASVVATGQDITSQLEMARRLEEAQTLAKHARESLAQARDQMDREVRNLETASEQVERRGARRRSFPHIQMIAPVRSSRLPAAAEFREIGCRDISSRGFSFLAPSPYDAKQLVIGFGSPPSAIHLLSDVVHVTPIRHEGRSVFHIGCRYVQRVTYPS